MIRIYYEILGSHVKATFFINNGNAGFLTMSEREWRDFPGLFHNAEFIEGGW